MQGTPTDDEVAAAVAAINVLLLTIGAAPQTVLPGGWQAATKLSQQGFPPVKVALVPTWGTIERLRRQ